MAPKCKQRKDIDVVVKLVDKVIWKQKMCKKSQNYLVLALLQSTKKNLIDDITKLQRRRSKKGSRDSEDWGEVVQDRLSDNDREDPLNLDVFFQKMNCRWQ